MEVISDQKLEVKYNNYFLIENGHLMSESDPHFLTKYKEGGDQHEQSYF